MSTFVFVPGEWLGGWCWLYVAADLRAAGNTVVDVTLTGLGERAHLLSREIAGNSHSSRRQIGGSQLNGGTISWSAAHSRWAHVDHKTARDPRQPQ
jgi:hypothetical protein